jgi:hypothetical protein
MTLETEEEPTADGRRIDAGLELLDMACDEIKEAVCSASFCSCNSEIQ